MTLRSLAFLPIFVLFFAPLFARADEIYPELATAGRRTEATLELKTLVFHMSADEEGATTGVYVAFLDDAADPVALAACDDDGDYVVVLSSALLVLVEHVAHAAAVDELTGAHTVSAYAASLARDQREGARLLPPPPGSFAPNDASTALATLEATRYREAVSGILARELAPMTRGDLVCPKPTATKERGDDVWTASEHARALSAATALYSAERGAQHDADSIARLLDDGHDETGYVAWLTFVALLEHDGPRVQSTYARYHTNANARLARARASVDAWHDAHDARDAHETAAATHK